MFVQQIRWSAGASAILGAVLAGVLAVLATPLVVQRVRGRRPPVALVVLVAVIAVLLVAAALTFSTLRVVVDDRAVTVGFGPFREHVALTEIRSCRPATYRPGQWGGYGIRLGRGAKLYNVAGDRGQAVELTRRDGHRVLFSSRDPAAACRAIRERRPEITG